MIYANIQEKRVFEVIKQHQHSAHSDTLTSDTESVTFEKKIFNFLQRRWKKIKFMMLVKQQQILYKSEKVGLVWVTDQVKSFVDFSVPFLSVYFIFTLHISGI